jgi:hypothetical protein
MLKTLLRHTLTKNIFDIVVDSLILYTFSLDEIPSFTIVCRIYFDNILVSEYKLFKRSNKANLFIALVQ